LGAGPAAVIHRADAVRFVEGLSANAYDVAFADPPYGHDQAAKVAERWLEAPFAGVLGVEHSARETLPGAGDRRRYGNTVITFYWSDR
jgi:16S rRNA (guanine966-N2)-methyltransferase